MPDPTPITDIRAALEAATAGDEAAREYLNNNKRFLLRELIERVEALTPPIDATPCPEFPGLWHVTQAAIDGFWTEYRADALRYRTIAAAFAGGAVTLAHYGDDVAINVGLQRYSPAPSLDEAVDALQPQIEGGQGQ